MHESRAEGTGIGQIAEELWIRVRHADIVDEDANIQILQLRSDLPVDCVIFGEVDVDDSSLDSILALCTTRIVSFSGTTKEKT